jgi:nitrous oxidase accessory protein
LIARKRPSCCRAPQARAWPEAVSGLVDKAPAGSVLRPPPGIYAGPGRHHKPLTIEGGGKVTIDAGDKGTVMVLNASNSTLRGLHLTGSGDSHDTDDSCLDVRGHNNVIEKLVIDNCLFGIDLKQSNDKSFAATESAPKNDLGVRGDGLRLWYSNDNLIEKNEIIDSRDMVAWYSHATPSATTSASAAATRSTSCSPTTTSSKATVSTTTRSASTSCTPKGGVSRNNIISHATGATGMAIGFKEASGTIIENNEIIYCGIGIGSDLSPFQPDSTIEMRGNRFAYNGIGILFNSETGGNNMVDNIFEGNLTQVSYGGRGDNNNSPRMSWLGNYWDDYQGFDRNSDGVGDQTTSCIPMPTRSGSNCRLPASSAVRRSWNCSIFSSAWPPSRRPT